MEKHSLPRTSAIALRQLQHIHREVQAASAELAEMIEIGGDIRQVWRKPRKYFVPDIGSQIPFPNGRLWRLVEPVFKLPASSDPRTRELEADIILCAQWWELVRKEIIPEKFN